MKQRWLFWLGLKAEDAMRMRSTTVFGVAGVWWLTIVGFVISGIDGQGKEYLITPISLCFINTA